MKRDITDQNGNNVIRLIFANRSTASPAFLNEDPVTYDKLDSCFANIFLCERRKPKWSLNHSFS